MCCVRVVGLVICFGIVIVVQEDSSTGDPVRCPMVDAAAVICGFAYKVGAFGLRIDGLVPGNGKWEFGKYPIVETHAVNVTELRMY